MLSRVFAPIKGIFASLLFLLNLLILPCVVIVFTPLCYLIPFSQLRKKALDFLHVTLPIYWVDICNGIIAFIGNTTWDIQGNGTLDINGWYFLLSNHRSWLDILVLQKVFNRKIPTLKFFMKKELLWTLPGAGLACWMMSYPFMTRYTKSYLRKHPERKGKDIEATRRACEKFQDQPITMINYLEGTRFTTEKHASQKSPYKHLLKPKAGGMAFVLATMHHCLHDMINVTIIYPEGTNLWRFLCGKIKKVTVRYEVSPITETWRGDYYNDKNFRVHFQTTLNALWHEKDKLINELKEDDHA